MLANQYETLGDPTLPTELSGVLRAAVERWATLQLDKPTVSIPRQSRIGAKIKIDWLNRFVIPGFHDPRITCQS